MALVEDETGYTYGQGNGSFYDGQSYFSGEILGADLLSGDGDMEAGSQDWSETGTPTTNEKSGDQAHGGISSWKIIADEAGDGIYGWNMAYTTTTDNRYKVVLYVYPDDTTNFNFAIRNGINNAYIYGPQDITGLTQDAWNKIIIYYTETSGGSEAFLMLRSTGVGTWYFDDATVHLVTSLSTQYASTGHRLEVRDSASKLAFGYIGAAEGGEATSALSNNVTGITKADPGVVSSTAHGLHVGEQVYFSGLNEMTELNNAYKTVTAVGSANVFSINDTSGYGAAETTGGACCWEVTTADAQAVTIFKDQGLVTEGWNVESGFDYNGTLTFLVFSKQRGKFKLNSPFGIAITEELLLGD